MYYSDSDKKKTFEHPNLFYQGGKPFQYHHICQSSLISADQCAPSNW